MFSLIFFLYQYSLLFVAHWICYTHIISYLNNSADNNRWSKFLCLMTLFCGTPNPQWQHLPFRYLYHSDCSIVSLGPFGFLSRLQQFKWDFTSQFIYLSVKLFFLFSLPFFSLFLLLMFFHCLFSRLFVQLLSALIISLYNYGILHNSRFRALFSHLHFYALAWLPISYYEILHFLIHFIRCDLFSFWYFL